MKYTQPRWTLRWNKVWVSTDGRANVQRYAIMPGLSLFTAWLDGRCLGETHGRKAADRLIRDALRGSLETCGVG